MDVVGKQDFTRLEFSMSFVGDIRILQQPGLVASARLRVPWGRSNFAPDHSTPGQTTCVAVIRSFTQGRWRKRKCAITFGKWWTGCRIGGEWCCSLTWYESPLETRPNLTGTTFGTKALWESNIFQSDDMNPLIWYNTPLAKEILINIHTLG